MATKSNLLASIPEETSTRKGKAKEIQRIEVPPVKPDTKVAKQFPSLAGEPEPVRRFVELTRQLKSAKASLEQMEPYFKGLGVEQIIKASCAAQAPIPSVRLVDVDVPGADPEIDKPALLITLKNDYKVDREKAEGALVLMEDEEQNPLNPDNYLDWELKAEFDTAAFVTNGRLDTKRYIAFVEAVRTVADQFGIKNPLSCTKVRVVRDDFHARRFAEFTVAENLELQAGALPAVVAAKAS